MFEDSLLDSGRREQTHRGATTLLSVAIQGVLVAALVIAPMIYTDSLPGFRLQAEAIAMPVTPPPRGITQRETTTGGSGGSGQITPILTAAPDDVIREPGEIPHDIADINDFNGPPDLLPGGHRGCPTCVPDGFGNILHDTVAVGPVGPPAPRRVSPPSHLVQGMLVRRVTPLYPPPAKAAGIQGQVVLRAVIGRDGSIESLRLVSGHPFLANAAVDAVQQWRYRPYILNGVPVEVDTTITVNFVLNR